MQFCHLPSSKVSGACKEPLADSPLPSPSWKLLGMFWLRMCYFRWYKIGSTNNYLPCSLDQTFWNFRFSFWGPSTCWISNNCFEQLVIRFRSSDESPGESSMGLLINFIITVKNRSQLSGIAFSNHDDLQHSHERINLQKMGYQQTLYSTFS